MQLTSIKAWINRFCDIILGYVISLNAMVLSART